MRSGGSRLDLDRGPVKLEILEEDSLEEEHSPLNKRRRKASASSGFYQLGAGANAFPIPPCQYNPLDEPSPLGLRLRKSPSLLDLIQMRISQGNSSSEVSNSQSHSSGVKKETQSATATSCSIEKMKASNFPATVLRIGQYEYKSKHEGDLVAKCYFAKHKLVWEVLEGGLKSKIEIQWSDIIGLKVVCPDNGPGTLNVVLAKHPLFFRETNPQPRKHTLWQATADFTDGQAIINRQHFLECQPELLSKNFEKLIQCDSRLKYLSQQADIVLDSPYFEATASIFEDLDGPGKVKSKRESPLPSPLSILQLSPSVESSSSKTERLDRFGASSETRSREASSPNSGTDARSSGAIEISEVVDSKDTRGDQHIKLPGLSKSISVSDFMNHLGQCITDSGIDLSSGNGSPCQELIDITEYLLNDTNMATASSDEKSLMSKVNSLCCLLQQEPTSCIEEPYQEKMVQVSDCTESSVNSEVKDQKQGMSRKDSFSDLLLHLPRIASLPKFLFDIPETG